MGRPPACNPCRFDPWSVAITTPTTTDHRRYDRDGNLLANYLTSTSTTSVRSLHVQGAPSRLLLARTTGGSHRYFWEYWNGSDLRDVITQTIPDTDFPGTVVAANRDIVSVAQPGSGSSPPLGFTPNKVSRHDEYGQLLWVFDPATGGGVSNALQSCIEERDSELYILGVKQQASAIPFFQRYDRIFVVDASTGAFARVKHGYDSFGTENGFSPVWFSLGPADRIYFGGRIRSFSSSFSGYAGLTAMDNDTVAWRRILYAWPDNIDVCHRTLVDSAGNVYVAGQFANDTLTIAKYDDSGTLLWNANHGALVHGIALSTDEAYVYTTGVRVSNLTTRKYDAATGSLVWSVDFKRDTYCVTVDPLTDDVLVGGIRGTL